MIPYDKNSFEEIRSMSAGDLVHTMLLEFENPAINDGIARAASLQSAEYFWAYERLNEMLPALDAT